MAPKAWPDLTERLGINPTTFEPREEIDREELRAAIEAEPMLRWFMYDHLSEPMRTVSKSFAWLADEIVEMTARSPERTVALRKLLESKDAAVRAALPTL